MWSYDHIADGTLYVTICLDRELHGPHFHYVRQVSTNRWNHHVVVRSVEQVQAQWFRELLELGYAFSNS